MLQIVKVLSENSNVTLPQDLSPSMTTDLKYTIKTSVVVERYIIP